MAKYVRGPISLGVYFENEPLPGNEKFYEPVIVIPEADWKRMVELAEDLMPLHACEDLCDCCADECEIKAIIEKVEAANG